MKSVTEFNTLKLADGLKAKTALAAEGKSPEEIAAALGEQFKFEGDKLKCFVNSIDIAEKSTEKLYMIKIARLNEGQNPPPRSTVVEDLCYIPVPYPDLTAKKEASASVSKDSRGGGKGNRPGGKGGGKPKDSPWGISPEEKEAKLAAARQAAREKSLAGKK